MKVHGLGSRAPPVSALWVLTLTDVKGHRGGWGQEAFIPTCYSTRPVLGSGQGPAATVALSSRESELHGEQECLSRAGKLREGEVPPGGWSALRLGLGGPGPRADETQRQLALQGELWRPLFSPQRPLAHRCFNPGCWWKQACGQACSAGRRVWRGSCLGVRGGALGSLLSLFQCSSGYSHLF